MKKTFLIIASLLSGMFSYTQVTEHKKMIELGKLYKDFMFRNEAPKEVLKDINKEVLENLKSATSFIIQTITAKNNLLSKFFLSRPDNKTLKQIYIISAINLNMREENQIDNSKLIDSLFNKEISVYEMLDNYYEMLFTSVGNKNQPFNLSKINLNLKEYNLLNDTENGILVLKAMNLCGTSIWGYMNIPKPANTKKALELINKFPKINGLPYYQFTDFYFKDFEMIIVENEGLQSYKSYYLNKFFETLLSHLICLNKEGGTEKEKNNLLLGSILKERNLYKYTKYKEILEDIFKEVKID
jgi:hypothetical protein